MSRKLIRIGLMTKKVEAFEQIMEHGVDTKNRRVYFGIIDDGDSGSEFSWSTVEKAVRGLHILASQNKQPIELHMNSVGGNSTDMLKLHDEILASPCKITFVGAGNIGSSATWIMACCDYRKLHQNARVVIHDGSDSNSDRHTDFLITARWSESHMNDLYQLYADNSRMSVEFWADICQRDVILTAEETVTLGLADEIIEPQARGNLRKARTRRLNQIDEPAIKSLTKSIYKRINKKRNLNKIEISIKPPEYDPNLVEEKEPEENTSDSKPTKNQETTGLPQVEVDQQSD